MLKCFNELKEALMNTPKFKEILLTRRQEIMNHSAQSIMTESENFPDELDQVTADAERDMVIRIERHKRENLLLINDALHRLQDGNFGTCKECEDQIELRRLIHNPLAVNCFSCQEDLEFQNSKFVPVKIID